MLRGVLLGCFSAVAFFVALGGLIERVGIAGGFAIAITVALAFQAGSLALVGYRGTPQLRPSRPPM